MEKKIELHILSPDPNVKPEELKTIIAELVAMHAKIHTANNEFYAKMDKANLPYIAYGYTWHGNSYGYGHGHHGCWRQR